MDVSMLKELPGGEGNFGKCYIIDDKTLYKKLYNNSDGRYNLQKGHLKNIANIENIDFTNEVALRIRMNFAETVEKLSYECKNGLTLIYLKVNTVYLEILIGYF